MYIKKIVYLFVIFVLFPFTASAKPFEQWLENVRQDALRQGVSVQTVDAALADVQPIPRVIELDRKQPEGRLTFEQYYTRVISPQRIKQGRYLYKKHRTELERASKKYNVPANYIVALWGIETNYGSNTGGFKVIHALATLAHDGRRSAFFRKELINALKIIDAGHISHTNMKGSWAGAMGQNQFMPSSFHNFAIDGNNDGKRDIWTSLPDVFASTANYLAQSGWKGDQRWGREVKVPQGFPESLSSKKIKKSLNQWKGMGIRLPGGGPIPVAPGIKAMLIAPDGLAGRTFLVYDNFNVIKKWNNSTYFATSVGLLADQIVQ